MKNKQQGNLGRQVFAIAWPAALESLLVGIVELVDMAMVSSLGLAVVSAVGVTSQPKRILVMFTLALNVGATALISRRIGEGCRKEANHCMHQFLWASILLALVLYSAGILLARPFVLLAGANEEIVEDAVVYFRILCVGQIPQAAGLTINACLRAEGKTQVTLVTNTTANLVNVIFNYLLIFGKCGFPELGVAGAAWATSVGSLAAFLISLWSVRPGNGGILYLDLLRERVYLDRKLLKNAGRITLSAFNEQFYQRLGLFIYTRIAASLGTVEFAVYQFVMNLANLQGYTYDGFAASATALTGQNLGMKDPDRAQKAGKYAVWMGYVTALIIAAVLLLFYHPILRVFTDDPYALERGGLLLRYVAIGCIPCAGCAIYSGILRGAGDTKAVARITFWIAAILRPFLAWLLCYPANLHHKGVWIAFSLAFFWRWILLYRHWLKGTWKQIKL